MAKNKKRDSFLWEGVTEEDFIDGSDVVDRDIGQFNESSMQIYGINVDVARYIAKLQDSLKPVERRILYAMYKIGAVPGKQFKSADLVSASMKLHNHGDQSIYSTIVGMIQNWKKAVPYIEGPSNFGSINNPDGYAAYRYSEANLTKYSMECFFSDFCKEAIGTSSFLTGIQEPKFLPCKFPNILVNGSSGVGYGHSATIFPYNINDILKLCRTYLNNPDAKDIIVYPDLPTNCNVVKDDEEIRKICVEGRGALKMRAQVDIEDEPSEWRLVITNIPFMTAYDSIKNQILNLGKSGVIKIKHMADESQPYIDSTGNTSVRIRLVIKLDKALDPKEVRNILYKKTDLEKTQSIIFKVINDDLKIKSYNLKGLVLAWIEERRLYKRSLYNHKINKLRASIDIRDILIELTEKDNLEKTIKIIKNSNTEQLISAFQKDYGMSSHQAKVIADMKLSAFTKDAHNRYVEERKDLKKELDELCDIAYNTKKIDKVILEELEDLKKYGPSERRSPIIELEGEDMISNTDHKIIFTTQGMIKKVPKIPDKYHVKNPYGSFAQGDVPHACFEVNNLDHMIMMDMFGRYSVMPVHQIPNTVYSSVGEKIYDVAKLEGKLIFGFDIPNPETENDTAKKNIPTNFDNFYLTTLSEQGIVKRTKLPEYIYSGDSLAKVKGTRGARLKDGDKLAYASIIMHDSTLKTYDSKVLIYTEKGDYVLLDVDAIPEMNKDTQGVACICPAENDKAVGFSVIFPYENGDEFVVVLTEKGYLKKVETKYLSESKKRKDSSYLITVSDDDRVIFVSGANNDELLYVVTKTGEKGIPVSDIPTLARKAKGQKLVPVPNGDAIINACIDNLPQG